MLGCFDANFAFDLVTTLVGLARVCYYLPELCLRLITTDVVESYFQQSDPSWETSLVSENSPCKFFSQFSRKGKPQPTSIQFNYPSVAFAQSVIITDEDRGLFRFLSGWMFVAQTTQQPWRRTTCWPHRMPYQAIDQSCSKIRKLHGALDHPATLRYVKKQECEHIHQQFVDYLERSCARDFQSFFHGADYAVFKMICQKTTSMFLADRLRRNKVIGSKSFRNVMISRVNQAKSRRETFSLLNHPIIAKSNVIQPIT